MKSGLTFKHAEETSKEDWQKLIAHDPILERAYEELDRFGWNETELLTYDQAEKYEGAYHASLAQKLDEGIEKGRAQGIQIGIEKGRAEGVEIGMRKEERKGKKRLC